MTVHPNSPPDPATSSHASPLAAHPDVDSPLEGLSEAIEAVERREPGWLRQGLRYTVRFTFWSVITLYFLFCTAVLVLRHAVLPNVQDYRADIEQAVSSVFKVPVTIGTIEAGWRGLRPRLSLKDVAAFDSSGRTALRLPEINATLSWESLALGDLRLDSLEIIRPDLDMRRDRAGKLHVAGLEIDPDQDPQGGLSEWVLSQPEIVVRGARLRWNDELRRAPELRLEGVHFVLQRSGRQHRFALLATPSAALASQVDLRGRFDTPIFSPRLAETERWRGEIYLRVAQANLAGWHAWIDYPMELPKATGALRAWLGFSALDAADTPGSRLLDLTADLQLNDVTTRLQKDLPELALARVSGRVRARTLREGHEFGFRNFSLLSADGLSIDATELSGRTLHASASKPAQGELRTDALNLDTLAMIAGRLPLSTAMRELLNDYQPRGKMTKLTFTWKGPIDTPVDYTLSGTFERLAILDKPAPPDRDGNHHPGRPGFTNLSGSIKATPRNGSVTVVAPGSTLRFPGVFAKPDVPFTKLSGTVSWTRADNKLEIRLPTLAFENADAAGVANLVWRSDPATANGPGWLDLDGQLTRADVRQVPRYLPLTLSADVRDWLGAAIHAGNSTDTRFRVKGDLRDFPFTESAGAAPSALAQAKGLFTPATAPGEFRVISKLRDVRFDYAPLRAAGTPMLWPLLESVNGDLIFERDNMQVRAASGVIQGVRFDRARADLNDLADPAHVLRVTGNLSGALQDYLRFVGTSPVGSWLGGFLTGARGTGAAQLDLKLDLPLNDLQASKVSGGLQLSNNDLTLPNGLPTLQRAAGLIDFTENNVVLRSVAGQFLGGPFKLDGRARADGRLMLRGEGSVVASALRQVHDNAFLERLGERLDGNLRYTMSLSVNTRGSAAPPSASGPPELVVESSLVGLAIDLPAPFQKSAATALPLRVELVPTTAGVEELRTTIGSSIHAVFERKADSNGAMMVTRAAYGINEPAILTDSLAFANINLKTLDLDAWQSAFNQLSGSVGTTRTGNAAGSLRSNNFLPDVVAVRAGELRFVEKTLANVVFAASRSRDVWQANINADQVSGHLTWREGATASQQGRLTARLARLAIPQSATTDVTTVLATSPREIPSLDIVAENFELRGKPLGRLELIADNTGSGTRREWRLNKLTVRNDDAILDGSGVWAPNEAGERQTSLNFKLSVSNVGKLMDRFGMKDTLRNGTATLRGDVAWSGSPLTIDYPSLDGHLNLEAERGQFLKADPGIAKLLGVLSLQGLPRRITLDFRDVFSEGFSFDSIRANAVIDNGIATTRDFSMRGVAATVMIDGSADLARETQNLHVLVLPQINAGAGSLAYALIANPLVGLATFIAQAILKDPLSRAFSFEYNVTGPWAEPNIVKLERSSAPDTSADRAIP